VRRLYLFFWLLLGLSTWALGLYWALGHLGSCHLEQNGSFRNDFQVFNFQINI
jgi:hypothetical protein